jgi:hypothetical protein
MEPQMNADEVEAGLARNLTTKFEIRRLAFFCNFFAPFASSPLRVNSSTWGSYRRRIQDN